VAPTYVSQNEAQISVDGLQYWNGTSQVSVGLPYVKSWSTFEGGDPTAETSLLLPGNTMPAVAIPGPVKRTNVTVTRPYTADVHALWGALEAAVNGPMHASYTPTDADGNTLSYATVTRTGLLKTVQPPKFSASTGEVAMFGLVMECNT
jgi:hypothetical protein